MTQVDIGPKEFTHNRNGHFLLSTPEFIELQTYVEAGKRLPVTEDDLQIKLGITKDDTHEFKDMIAVYKQIVTHCRYFSDTTFPASVGLAADIVHYNLKVPIYYGALNPIIDDWNDGSMSPEMAKKKLDAILKNLRASAISFKDNAATVKQKIHQFVEETIQDESDLKSIRKRYQNHYHGEGLDKQIEAYRTQAENAGNQIRHWNKEYQHDVTVASTSATYGWMWPFGTIAAGVVAGVYGKKATDALEEVHKYQKKLETAQGELRKALNLQHDLDLANDSLNGILKKVDKAVDVLQKMEGAWGAIADDLTNILNVIDQGIDKAPAIIKDLGVTNAINAWSAASEIADAYRANAYITVESEETIKQDPNKYKLPQASTV